jgi:hypothetical protein
MEKLDAAKDDKERASAAKELLLAKSRYLAGRLTDIALTTNMHRSERREEIATIQALSSADLAVYSMQRVALGIDKPEETHTDAAARDLETVLREMETAGEISAPKVSVNDAAQREPTGLSAEVTPS